MSSLLSWSALVSRADRLRLSFPLQAERSLEHRKDRGLRLADAAFRSHRLLGRELHLRVRVFSRGPFFTVDRTVFEMWLGTL